MCFFSIAVSEILLLCVCLCSFCEFMILNLEIRAEYEAGIQSRKGYTGWIIKHCYVSFGYIQMNIYVCFYQLFSISCREKKISSRHKYIFCFPLYIPIYSSQIYDNILHINIECIFCTEKKSAKHMLRKSAEFILFLRYFKSYDTNSAYTRFLSHIIN